MHDVARLAGVSQTTVSFVLSGRTPPGVQIGDATRSKVLESAAALGYRKNEAAKALVTGRFSSIQLLVSDITDPYFDQLVHGVETEAYRLGYQMLLRSTWLSEEMERAAFDQLQRAGVDGVVMCGIQMPDTMRRELSQDNYVVFIEDRPSRHSPGVFIDDAAGFRDAMAYLSSHGTRRVAYVSGAPVRVTSRTRDGLFREAAKTFGMEVVEVPRQAEDGIDGFSPSQVEQVAALVGTVDNIFCFNDTSAISLMNALVASGVRIPDDIGIVGFDGIAMGEVVTPALSTISVPRFELGRRAMLLLHSMILGEVAPGRVTITPHFAPRTSHKS
jgi:DNA-binding LacI/PurR family transcriptional regulator